MKNDYANIYLSAQNTQEEIIKISSKKGKGIRIFNQDKFECIVSFIISQNNNIPRIKGIIEKLCTSLGEKKTFENHTYFAFPTATGFSTCSSMVLNAPHPGQRPIHFGVSFPQFVQKKTVFAFAILRLLRSFVP